jgi:drug/metabolite transporter (DMT)-like permease
LRGVTGTTSTPATSDVAAAAGSRRVRPALGMAMVAASAALFALNGTVSKLLLKGGFDATQLATFRATGGFLGLLLIISVIKPGPRRLVVRRDEVPRLIIFGLAGFFIVPLLYFVAIRRLPVGIALLFEYTAPLLVALWARFGEHQRVRSRLWVGLALSLVGLAFVAQLTGGHLRLDALGVAAGLGCSVLLGFYYVLGARSVARRDPASVTCWAIGVAALAGAVLRPWWHFPAHLLAGSSGGVPMWLLATYLVLFGTIGAYVLVSAGMQHLPPTSVGIIGMLEPVLASVIAWVALGEVLATQQLIGGSLVIAGVILAETARTAGAPVTPEPPLT